MVKYALSSRKPNVVGKTLPLRSIRIKGPRIVKRPDPGTFVNKKGILPAAMKTRKLSKANVVNL